MLAPAGRRRSPVRLSLAPLPSRARPRAGRAAVAPRSRRGTGGAASHGALPRGRLGWASRVLEYEFSVLIEAPPVFVEDLADAKTGRSKRHHEDGRTVADRHIGIGPCAHEKEFSHAAISDEGFLAVEQPIILAVALRAEPP